VSGDPDAGSAKLHFGTKSYHNSGVIALVRRNQRQSVQEIRNFANFFN
jgi:hypothetical protein